MRRLFTADRAGPRVVESGAGRVELDRRFLVSSNPEDFGAGKFRIQLTYL